MILIEYLKWKIYKLKWYIAVSICAIVFMWIAIIDIDLAGTILYSIVGILIFIAICWLIKEDYNSWKQIYYKGEK